MFSWIRLKYESDFKGHRMMSRYWDLLKLKLKKINYFKDTIRILGMQIYTEIIDKSLQ